MSFLDLLHGPQLSSSEVARLRSMLSPERPWESGVAERVVTPQERENAYLRARIGELELGVKILCDILTERGLLEANGFATRIAGVREQIAAEERRLADEAAQRIEAARRAADERTVQCASCSATVRQRASFMSANGPLCPPCHERSAPSE